MDLTQTQPADTAAESPKIPAELLRALSRPTLHRWLAAALTDWALIVAVFAAARAVHHPVGYLLAAFALGSRQQALGALFHDAAHHLASADRSVNDALGNALCAFPLGLTLGGYRRYHFAHHRHLGTEGDPEVAHKRTLPHWNLPARPIPLAAHFASDLVGAGIPHLVAAGGLTRPTRPLEAAAMALEWALALALAWRFEALWVPALWVASIATVFWSGVRLRIWTEHLGTRDTHRLRVRGPLGWAMFPHGIGHHWEHHHFPSVPFWNLDALRRALPPNTPGCPPIRSLTELFRAFARAPRLPSGALGAVVSRAPLPSPPRPAAPAGYARHVVVPLALGAAAYVTCREHPPAALAWLPLRGLFASPAATHVADHLPDALWAYALTALQAIVWRGDRSLAGRLWVASAPAALLLWELGQRQKVLPGTFDPIDLGLSLLASAAAVIACAPHLSRRPHAN